MRCLAGAGIRWSRARWLCIAARAALQLCQTPVQKVEVLCVWARLAETNSQQAELVEQASFVSLIAYCQRRMEVSQASRRFLGRLRVSPVNWFYGHFCEPHEFRSRVR